jgi:hypothetical protein
VTDFRRVVVVGADKDLAAVLKQLLRATASTSRSRTCADPGVRAAR